MSLSHFFFLTSVAVLPLQLNKYFFWQKSLVLGIPIDYRALAIYSSDLAIVATILFTFWSFKKAVKVLFKDFRVIMLALMALNLYLVLNSVLTSSEKTISLTYALKFLELSLWGLSALVVLNSPGTFKKLKTVVKWTLLWQSIIVVLQFVFQRSLGLTLLGERTFDITTTQIASTNLFGEEFLRAYGTFPHPNILGAFILISATLADIKFKVPKRIKRVKDIFESKNIIALFALLALLLTFSKTALCLGLIYIFLKTEGRKKLAVSAAVLLVLIGFLSLHTESYITSLAERVTLAEAAIEIAFKNLATGVGPNNFIPHLAQMNIISISQVRLLQPVHNVFLLTLSEWGVVGLLGFSFLIFKVVEKIKTKEALYLAIVILTYLTVDHFLLTLHQGLMIFFLSLSFITISKNKA